MAERINNYNGIINIYKEAGFTSFDVVAKMRGICGQKKIGHTGTLDPDATGVLPVCLGNATKVCELLTDHDKEYVAELLLGVKTDTQDATGRVIGGCLDDMPTEDEIRSVAKSFLGEIEQVPPMYSALKVNGQKLCDLARKGVEIERVARPVTIFELEIYSIGTFEGVAAKLGDMSGATVIKMRVRCSKGTYIRTLCEDIGEKLGCGGTMLSLVRTKVGPFTLDNAIRLSQVQELRNSGALGEAVMAVDSLFMENRALTVKQESMKLLLNGNVLKAEDYVEADCADVDCEEADCADVDYVEADCTDVDCADVDCAVTAYTPANGELFRIYKADGTFAGMYYYNEKDRLYKPEKMFL